MDSEGFDVYASNMKTISARVLMLIAAANNYEVLTGDISTGKKSKCIMKTRDYEILMSLGSVFIRPSILIC